MYIYHLFSYGGLLFAPQTIVTEWTLNIFFSLQVGETGKVYGIDHIDQLVKDSLANIKRGNPELLEKDRVKIVSKYDVQ